MILLTNILADLEIAVQRSWQIAELFSTAAMTWTRFSAWARIPKRPSIEPLLKTFTYAVPGIWAWGVMALGSPFVHLGAHNAHPCNIESIGQLGLESPDTK